MQWCSRLIALTPFPLSLPGESAIPHLFTVLAEDASVAGEPDVKKGLKISQRIKKGVKSLANPKDLLRNRLYIVFLCDYRCLATRILHSQSRDRAATARVAPRSLSLACGPL